jgi:hypothetical protein
LGSAKRDVARKGQRLLFDEAEIGKSTGKFTESKLGFKLSELCAQTEMNSLSECQAVTALSAV